MAKRALRQANEDSGSLRPLVNGTAKPFKHKLTLGSKKMSATKKLFRSYAERCAYLFILLTVSHSAHAAPWDFWGNVANFFVSDIARGIALLAIVVFGLAFYTGHVSKERAMYIGGGFVLIFGGPSIVAKLIELIS